MPLHFRNGSGSFAFVFKVKEAGRAEHVAGLAVSDVVVEVTSVVVEVTGDVPTDVVGVTIGEVVRIVVGAAAVVPLPGRHCEYQALE